MTSSAFANIVEVEELIAEPIVAHRNETVVVCNENRRGALAVRLYAKKQKKMRFGISSDEFFVVVATFAKTHR